MDLPPEQIIEVIPNAELCQAEDRQLTRIVDICPNPKLITEPKTSYIQTISTLFALKGFSHSPR